MRHLGTVLLMTERLILRRFTVQDAEAMYRNWASDPACSRFLSWSPHRSVEETRALLTDWVALYEKESYNWLVEIKQTGEAIGNISLIRFSEQNDNGEIGYCYGSRYWNQGYATEALAAVIDFCLIECDLHLVEARHISGNPASGRVMQKAGMQKDAVLRERSRNKDAGRLDDLIFYSAIRQPDHGACRFCRPI